MSHRPGPVCNNRECPCATPGPVCPSFEDGGWQWCARCGWEEHDHRKPVQLIRNGGKP